MLTEIQQRTAEQLFRTLGELKGGAMKFGQALSVLESALPEDVAGPYREQLTLLQDSAPPMPTQTVREALERELGPDWQQQLVWLDGGPTAAASIGQVHKGRWHDGREVAVKVQYPGAGDALRSDLRQLARLARTIGPLVPGVDIKPLVEELQARAVDELDYHLEAEAQRAFAEAFRDDPDIVVPDVVAVGETVLVTEWLESPASLASIIADGTPGGARPLRRAARPLPLLRAGPHRHAARRPASRELPGHADARREAGPDRGPRLRGGGPAAGAQPARGHGHG